MPTYGLKFTKLTADGSVFGTRTRVRAVHAVCGATAGSIILLDGGSGGVSRLDVDTPASATAVIALDFQEQGILFETDCYLDLTNVTSVTVFYDG